MSIGMNLASVNYWTFQNAFIDRFKSAASFYMRSDTYRGEITDPTLLDSNGWPINQAAGTWYGFQTLLDPEDSGETHRFVITWSGTGNFVVTGGTIVSREANKIVIDAGGSILSEYQMSNSDPVHDIHIVREDQVALFNAGELFTPEFIEKTSVWSVLRFMDWDLINHSTAVDWSTRETLATARWENVPIEAEIALGNKTHSDVWLNIPAMANDDYVRQLVTYVRDHLDPGLKLHLEYSNEIWNTGFSQNAYAQQQADALWGNGGTVSAGSEIYYGYRAAQVMKIAKDVFGLDAEQRFEGVLGVLTGYEGYEVNAFDGINRAGLGAASTLFKEYAVTTYFGGQLSAWGYAADMANDKDKILAWARSGEAGLAAAFQEIVHGGSLASDDSLDNLLNYWKYHGQVAAANGLSMVAYEGGFSGGWFSWSGDQQNEIVDFIKRILADPRMKDVYTTMINYFQSAGGEDLVAYTDVGTTSIWGPWGTLDTIYGDSPRYEALKEASGRIPVTLSPTPTTTTPVSQDATKTQLSNVTMADGATTLTYNGTSAFTGTGNALDNTLTGGAIGNRLYGLGGNDTLIGGASADYLDGGTGVDRMVGGAGNDVYIVDDLGDVVVENASEGSDEIRTSLASYTLPANVEKLVYTGTGDFRGIGNALDNTLTGGAGNDYLDGGAGADRLIGGAGNDVYVVDNAGDVVVENAGEGTDEVQTTLASYTLGANVENLSFIGSGAFAGTGNALANVIKAGSGGSQLAGGAGNDTLIGGTGADILDGGTGADRMTGGLGDDVYVIDDTGDVAIENAGEGTDEIRTSLASYTLAANFENLTFTGAGSFVGTGNALNNVIKAGSGGSQLYGGAGNDTLEGGAGADLLDGGSGADRMSGGAGSDTYLVDDAGDMVVEAANGGVDNVRTSLGSYALTANVENLTYTGTLAFTGYGNDLDNIITGSTSAANRLYGGAGNDTLIGGSADDYFEGGAGNDTYLVTNSGDVVVEAANGGTDLVRTSLASYTLTANVENLTYTGTLAFTGVGNVLDNVITGAANAANRLYGGDGNDTLYGGSAADYFDGGSGNDVMVGGAGNDVYIVRDTGDSVVEQANGGLDEVRSYANTYSLSDNIEVLTFVGTGDFLAFGSRGDDIITGGSGNDTLIGADGNDTLIGGAGNDRLDGGAGADRLIGGTGDDMYFVGDANDRVYESANEGYDTVYSSVSFTLASNVEALVLTSSANINGTGNAAANYLQGSAGNNILDGGAGNDNLDGGAGNDTLIGGAGADTLKGGTGADTFVFRPGDLLAPGVTTDRITDFSRSEGDRIDFSALRPTAGTALSFIGTNAFDRHAGQVRVTASGSDWDVSIDLNGDGRADLHLMVTSSTGVPMAADFLL